MSTTLDASATTSPYKSITDGSRSLGWATIAFISLLLHILLELVSTGRRRTARERMPARTNTLSHMRLVFVNFFFASDILDFSSCFAALGFVARALLHLVVCSSSLYIVTLPSSRRHDTFLRIYTHMAYRRRYGTGGGSVPVAARCGKRGERDCFDSFRFGTCMQCRSFLCADWGLAGRSASVDATPSFRGIGSLLWDGMTWDNRLHSGHELVWHR
jgi:hypothetical protein